MEEQNKTSGRVLASDPEYQWKDLMGYRTVLITQERLPLGETVEITRQGISGLANAAIKMVEGQVKEK